MELAQYLPVENFPSYRVGSDGSVWSCAKGKAWYRLKPTIDRDGYGSLRLYGPNGTWKQVRVCVLICTTFHGPCPPENECRHLDGNSTNDAATNLCWGTSLENKADQERHGTKRRGETHHNATLSDADVEAIRGLKGKMLQREVAALYGTNQGYVSDLWSGRRRKEKAA